MKKKLFIIGLCGILLLMPTILAFPTTIKPSPLFSPPKMSDGTFIGGLGRGHWGNGFIIDSVYAYMHGVYWSGPYIRISGELTNLDDEKIGEISALITSKIILGYTKNMQGQKSPIIGFLMENKNNQFVGRIIFSRFKSVPHIWGYMIENI